MIKPEELDIFINLLKENGEYPTLLKKLELMKEITKISEESRAKLNELQKELNEIKD